jgi:hypothetical protein
MYGGDMYGGSMYGGEYGSDMYGSGMYGGDMYGSETGMGYGAGGYGASAMRRPLVKFLMVRFFDHTAEVGKSYRYRVRVVLEDPNRPYNPQTEPSKRMLDPDVIARLSTIEEQDRKYGELVERTGTPPKAAYWTLPPWGERERPARTFFVRTDWSEPSDVCTVQGNERVVAGSVAPPRYLRLTTTPGPGPEVLISEAEGNVVAVDWDWQRGVEVPAQRSVRRGAYLNFTQNADVMHPVTSQLKTLEQYSFNLEGLVLDLRGGDPMIVEEDGDEKRTLAAPGEFMMFDRHGNLIVRHEVRDMEEYRRLLFIEETAQTSAGSMMGSGYEGGLDMGSGYEQGGYFGP